MRVNKRHFTLLEAMIALVLTALLISALTFFYRAMTSVDQEIEATQKIEFKYRLLENRLASVLPMTVNSTNADFQFFTTSDAPAYLKPGSPSLTFTFNNRIDLDKKQSNEVIAMLLVDKFGRLVLATWPPPSTWGEGKTPDMKQQVLLEGVAKIEFQFFVPPESGEAKPMGKGGEASYEISPKGDWRSDWEATFHQLPAIVKIKVFFLDNKVRPYELAFPLPLVEQPIYYGI